MPPNYLAKPRVQKTRGPSLKPATVVPSWTHKVVEHKVPEIVDIVATSEKDFCRTRAAGPHKINEKVEDTTSNSERDNPYIKNSALLEKGDPKRELLLAG